MLNNIFNLKPHQQKGEDYCNKVDNPALLMEMRLGKIRTIMSAAINIYDAQRILVVCPPTALYGWVMELNRCGIEFVSPTLCKNRREGFMAFLDSGVRVCLVHDQMYMSIPEMKDCPWDFVIKDESQSIKNPKADITKYYLKSFPNNRKAILTGTPALNHPLDYFTQFKFIDEKPFGFFDYYSFRNALFYKAGFKFLPKHGTKDRMAEYIGKRAFVLRKQDAGINTSEQIHQIRTVKFNDAARKMYQKIKTEYRTETVSTLFTCAAYSWMKKLSAGGFSPDGNLVCEAKYNELYSMLENDEGSRTVVFFSYNSEIDKVYKDLSATRHCIKLNGDVPILDRPRLIEEFHNSTDAVLLAQISVCDAGLDLSCSELAYVFSLTNDPTKYVQMVERLVNLNKISSILYIYLCYEDSVEIPLYDGLVNKKITNSEMLANCVKVHLEHYSD